MYRVGSCPVDVGTCGNIIVFMGCSKGGWEWGELLGKGASGMEVCSTGGPSIMGLLGCVGNCGELDRQGGDTLVGGCIFIELICDFEGPRKFYLN
jgi:hypothetical protein